MRSVSWHEKQCLSWIAEKVQNGETVGVMLLHRESDAGMTLLARNTEEIMLSPTINRKTMKHDCTDVSWYLRRIAVPLEQYGCRIEQITYQELIG